MALRWIWSPVVRIPIQEPGPLCGRGMVLEAVAPAIACKGKMPDFCSREAEGGIVAWMDWKHWRQSEKNNIFRVRSLIIKC